MHHIFVTFLDGQPASRVQSFIVEVDSDGMQPASSYWEANGPPHAVEIVGRIHHVMFQEADHVPVEVIGQADGLPHLPNDG